MGHPGRGRGGGSHGSSRGRGKPRRSRHKVVPSIDEVRERNENVKVRSGAEDEGDEAEEEEEEEDASSPSSEEQEASETNPLKDAKGEGKEEASGNRKRLSDEDNGGREGASGAAKGQTRHAKATKEHPMSSSEDDLPPNPNYVKSGTNAPVHITRRQREELERQERDRNLDSMRAQGKTPQARADLARLADIRAKRDQQKGRTED